MTLSNQRAARDLRAAFARDRKRTQQPVSRQEMDTRKAERARPAAGLHHTPGGTTEQSVHTALEAARETRIGFITKRLHRQQSQARDGFNRTR